VCARKVDCQVEECYTGEPKLLSYAAVVIGKQHLRVLLTTYCTSFFHLLYWKEKTVKQHVCLVAKKIALNAYILLKTMFCPS
jgi:hypothetical protein